MEKKQLAREHLELQLAFAGALEVLRLSAPHETDPKGFRCDVKDLRESDFDRFFEDFEGDAQDLGALNAAELSESDAKGLAVIEKRPAPHAAREKIEFRGVKGRPACRLWWWRSSGAPAALAWRAQGRWR